MKSSEKITEAGRRLRLSEEQIARFVEMDGEEDGQIDSFYTLLHVAQYCRGRRNISASEYADKILHLNQNQNIALLLGLPLEEISKKGISWEGDEGLIVSAYLGQIQEAGVPLAYGMDKIRGLDSKGIATFLRNGALAVARFNLTQLQAYMGIGKAEYKALKAGGRYEDVMPEAQFVISVRQPQAFTQGAAAGTLMHIQTKEMKAAERGGIPVDVGALVGSFLDVTTGKNLAAARLSGANGAKTFVAEEEKRISERSVRGV